MEWTIHWLNEVLVFIYLHWGIHVRFVEAQVTAGLPEPAFADMRRKENLISVLIMFISPPVFQFDTNTTPFRVPVYETGTGFLMGREEVELFA
jgi:hypothetical protein